MQFQKEVIQIETLRSLPFIREKTISLVKNNKKTCDVGLRAEVSF